MEKVTVTVVTVTRGKTAKLSQKPPVEKLWEKVTVTVVTVTSEKVAKKSQKPPVEKGTKGRARQGVDQKIYTSRRSKIASLEIKAG